VKPEFGGNIAVHLWNADVIFNAKVTRPVLGAKVFVRKDGTFYTMGKK
jgi:hypothetical protein